MLFGVGVGVLVGVGEGLTPTVGVGLEVTPVGVLVGLDVGVLVAVGVPVAVPVGWVAVGDEVPVGLAVLVAVGVPVAVDVGEGVGVPDETGTQNCLTPWSVLNVPARADTLLSGRPPLSLTTFGRTLVYGSGVHFSWGESASAMPAMVPPKRSMDAVRDIITPLPGFFTQLLLSTR